MKAVSLIGLVFTGYLAMLASAGPTDVETETVRPTRESDLVLRIESKTLSLVIREDRPKISATLINRGHTAVRLVQPGDGSESGWRTPLIAWSAVRSAAGEKVKHPTTAPLYRGPRCGFMNALKPSEIFTLVPGERTPLNGWVDIPSFPEPGIYDVVLYYSNDPGLKWHAEAGQDPEALQQVRKSFPCALVSNPLRFVVRKQPD